jgi:hypothetical protein
MAGKRQTADRSWCDLEVQDSKFQDVGLLRRFVTLLKQLWTGMGK